MEVEGQKINATGIVPIRIFKKNLTWFFDSACGDPSEMFINQVYTINMEEEIELVEVPELPGFDHTSYPTFKKVAKIIHKKEDDTEKAKEIGRLFLEIANETIETIDNSTEDRDKFAIGFLKYVEDTYIKQGDQYYFRAHGLTGVNRNIIEVLDNYKHFEIKRKA